MDGSVKVGDFGLVTAITRPSDGMRKYCTLVTKHDVSIMLHDFNHYFVS